MHQSYLALKTGAYNATFQYKKTQNCPFVPRIAYPVHGCELPGVDPRSIRQETTMSVHCKTYAQVHTKGNSEIPILLLLSLEGIVYTITITHTSLLIYYMNTWKTWRKYSNT